MIVKDSMVLIHLAKITVLEKSCIYFGKAVIPKAVYNEILAGEDKGYGDVKVIKDLVKSKRITIKQVVKKVLIRHAEEFNIQKGEGEALALYWQEKASYLATDDDNVRRKRALLGINVIGTPAIIMRLYGEKMIDRSKLKESVTELKKIGWFSNEIIDKMLIEG